MALRSEASWAKALGATYELGMSHSGLQQIEVVDVPLN
jgi:hypothetical protein